MRRQFSYSPFASLADIIFEIATGILHSEYKDMTKIIIAQRIRSVMDADEILVLDNGKTAGFGTHEQLLADCPVYREIYDVQNGREE